ncbi:MAG: DUF6870 family protein [Lachnospiraceae bacterium]
MDDFGISHEELEALRQVDIRTVEPAALVDIKNITIDEALPREERIAAFIAQVKNPYCFKVGKIVVGIGYSDNEVSFQQRLENYLQTL